MAVTSLAQKELDAISGYIRINYYTKLKKTESLNRNTILDNGILLIMHKYCKPLLLTAINARELSHYTSISNARYKSFGRYNKKKINLIPNSNQMENIKCVVVGQGGVGKTCLLIRYTTHEFPGEYIPTIFDNYSANIMIDDIPIQLGLWDTAGGEDYHQLRPLSYPETDIFIICMSVYDGPSTYYGERTMDKSGMWTNLAVNTMAFCQELQALLPDTPRILVGTKTDLRDDKKFENDCYSKKDMEIFSDIFGCHGYIECSALTGDYVNETFDYVIQTAIKGITSETSKKNCAIL